MRTDTTDEEEHSCSLGRCGETYIYGKPCYCHAGCENASNCCYDYHSRCSGKMLT